MDETTPNPTPSDVTPSAVDPSTLPPMSLPYRLRVEGSAQRVATGLLEAARVVGSFYRSSPLRLLITAALHETMQQLTKVARPDSRYIASVDVEVGDTNGIEVVSGLRELPNACPSGFESVAHFEAFVKDQSREAASSEEGAAAAVAVFEDIMATVLGRLDAIYG